MYGIPFGMGISRNFVALAKQLFGIWTWSNADHHSFPGRPRSGNGLCPHIVQKFGIDLVGYMGQHELAQSYKIAALEKVLYGALSLRGNVYLSFFQPLEELL